METKTPWRHSYSLVLTSRHFPLLCLCPSLLHSCSVEELEAFYRERTEKGAKQRLDISRMPAVGNHMTISPQKLVFSIAFSGHIFMSVPNILGTSGGDRHTRTCQYFRAGNLNTPAHRGSCANKPIRCLARSFASISESLLLYAQSTGLFLFIYFLLNSNVHESKLPGIYLRDPVKKCLIFFTYILPIRESTVGGFVRHREHSGRCAIVQAWGEGAAGSRRRRGAKVLHLAGGIFLKGAISLWDIKSESTFVCFHFFLLA